MSEADSVRFGLIGFGLFGTHHANAIAGTSRATLNAIGVKSDKSQAAARKAHPNAAVVSDYRELLARDDVDVVDVVAPNHLHHEIGRPLDDLPGRAADLVDLRIGDTPGMRDDVLEMEFDRASLGLLGD